MHDGFFGKRQPETQALFNLTEREHTDLINNMHTGASYMLMDRPFGEPALQPAFDSTREPTSGQIRACSPPM